MNEELERSTAGLDRQKGRGRPDRSELTNVQPGSLDR